MYEETLRRCHAALSVLAALYRALLDALHVAASKGREEIARLLLDYGADVTLRTRYGTSALHEATQGDSAAIARLLLAAGADVDARDRDGLTPLHRACQSNSESNEVFEELLRSGADVRAVDAGMSTPLHVAVCSKSSAAYYRVRELLERGTDPAAENAQEWTAMHLALSCGREDLFGAIEDFASEHDPEFVAAFDRSKPRNVAHPSQLSPADFRARVEPTLDGIAARILSGAVRNVVVLAGAGMSVSAGVPDFRSAGGLHTREMALRYGVDKAGELLSAEHFMRDPRPFYRVVRDLFLPIHRGEVRPTAAHHFVALLARKGLLRRLYTQNVDMLDYAAGVADHLVVESHGTLRTAHCTSCRAAAEMGAFWAAVARGDVPACAQCGATVIPDTVFFGMALPQRFHATRAEDMRACDLLLVMGTSLEVYPFAALVNDVPESTPRVLFNREAVGPWRSGLCCATGFRDVCVLGECDDGVRRLAELLGWSSELSEAASGSRTTPTTGV
eukprot:m51a1_g6975 putative nad-dependent protein deacetylase sirtuin-2 (505) ;mRNA; r:114231-116089